ncbi:MAG: SDR family oxidoreductase [Candidatus Thermoplasmatota archaeon]|nr:SDR family oxidoreductase [Candidatus Thermoplasmatota archaeon]
MPIAVVTGANRGIGSEWVNQLLENGWTVYAGYRKKLDKLENFSNSNLFIHQLDVQSKQSVIDFCNQVEGPVDLLVNNAGVGDGRWQKLEEIDDKWSLDVLDINAIGPVRMVQALYEKMSHDKLTKVAMISSLMGSIDDCKSGRSYAYRASKSALNMFTAAMKNEAVENNITFAILHPGWVKTGMGGSMAPVTMPESVNGMMKVLESQTLENSGRFIQYDGEILPW